MGILVASRMERANERTIQLAVGWKRARFYWSQSLMETGKLGNKDGKAPLSLVPQRPGFEGFLILARRDGGWGGRRK